MINRKYICRQSWMFSATLLKAYVSTFECMIRDEDDNHRYNLDFRVICDE